MAAEVGNLNILLRNDARKPHLPSHCAAFCHEQWRVVSGEQSPIVHERRPPGGSPRPLLEFEARSRHASGLKESITAASIVSASILTTIRS